MDDTHDSLLFSPYFKDKVVLIGDNGVGKTSIFNRFLTGTFERDTGQYSSVAEYKKRWEVDGKQVSMSLFDTGEREFIGEPGHTPATLFSGGKAVLMVYSIDDSESFGSLGSWFDVVLPRASEAVIALVGNKLDLEYKREVMKARAKEFAELYEIPSDLIFEVSAKDNTNIQSMFDTVATKIQPATKKSEILTVTKPPSNRRWKMC